MTRLLKPLPPVATLKTTLPLSKKERKAIALFRLMSREILNQKDTRLVIVAGPCSIHDPKLALQYAHCLNTLSLKVKSQIFLVMRVFLEKPRTHLGWKGFLYDPFLNGSHAVEQGIHLSRKLLIKLVQIGVPVATEFLDPILSGYVEDLITWGIIGARTSASPIHRQMASHLPMPIGFKNGIDGAIEPSIYGAMASRHSQTFIGINEKGRVCAIQTDGNPCTHLILRGSQTGSNYDPVSIHDTLKKQKQLGLNAPLLIDCAHGNSQKNPQQQPIVFQTVLEQILEGNQNIAGMFLESHLKEGHALSITDPCLDWKTTKELILSAYHSLKCRRHLLQDKKEVVCLPIYNGCL